MLNDDFPFPLEGVSMGIGADIECINRFRTEFKGRTDPSLNRIFTNGELDYCFSYRDHAPHLAARYCAKEAMTKALSSIGIRNLPYNEIEVYNNAEVPRIRIRQEGLPMLRSHLSLSHTQNNALAFVVIIVRNPHVRPDDEPKT